MSDYSSRPVIPPNASGGPFDQSGGVYNGGILGPHNDPPPASGGDLGGGSPTSKAERQATIQRLQGLLIDIDPSLPDDVKAELAKYDSIAQYDIAAVKMHQTLADGTISSLTRLRQDAIDKAGQAMKSTMLEALGIADVKPHLGPDTEET